MTYVLCFVSRPPQRTLKETGLVLTTGMVGVKALVAELAHIHKCSLGIRKLHTALSSRTSSVSSARNSVLIVHSSAILRNRNYVNCSTESPSLIPSPWRIDTKKSSSQERLREDTSAGRFWEALLRVRGSRAEMGEKTDRS